MRQRIHTLSSDQCIKQSLVERSTSMPLGASRARKRLRVFQSMALSLTVSLLHILYIATSAQAQVKVPRNAYTLVDLGVNEWAIGEAINSSGQVVGNMGIHAFRTMGNQPILPSADDLGVLPGHHRSFAYAINNNGVVVGFSANDAAYQWKAFRFGFNGGGMEDLHNISLGIHSAAFGINDFNWMVGSFTKSSQLTQAMISFGPGSTFSLEFALGFPRESEAHAVNNNEQIVGWLSTSSTAPKAFLYDARIGVNRVVHLGILPGGYTSKALGINDLGHVVGQANQGAGWHAFLWKDDNNNGVSDPGEMRDLAPGYPCSGALSINNGGTAVGYYCSNSPQTYGEKRAFMFSTNGQLVDLNTQILPGSGFTLREAKGINDNGQIVGWMQNQAGTVHTFRLDPVRRLFFP